MIAFTSMSQPTVAVSYTVGRLDDDRWHLILDEFDDASIFQTVPFVRARSRSEEIEHLVVRREGSLIAAAQVRVIRVPLTGAAIAYVLWGPLCHRRNEQADWGALAEALRALRENYVIKRGMSVRVTPCLGRDTEAARLAVFEREGYAHEKSVKAGRTIVIDLTHSLEDLRKGLDKKWRNCLSSAERNGLEITEGSDDELFEPFLEVYRQMLSRKNLAEPGDIRSFRAMQELLPPRQKMRVIIARDVSGPCAGAICSGIGRKGIYLFGGTADAGMKNKASYLVQWRAIQWLKKLDCTEYDLHGINPESNPGVYAFKTGLSGKNGRQIEFVGNFEAHSNTRNRLLLRAADRMNHERKRLKAIYGKYRGFQG